MASSMMVNSKESKVKLKVKAKVKAMMMLLMLTIRKTWPRKACAVFKLRETTKSTYLITKVISTIYKANSLELREKAMTMKTRREIM